jgi:hypothetical protein
MTLAVKMKGDPVSGVRSTVTLTLRAQGKCTQEKP